ncbi:diguanylate cyclase domain-containing protein [uncultured Mitsuokella sp.]|uniref:sensor domain-containing diguanylate cyclase n=1 Tax=uncultured Mitsuokella sp. TaxID=453120 RepID=UPI00259AC60F|nr:diguanylate cyclase [uncultured Mitsuokella sp.]
MKLKLFYSLKRKVLAVCLAGMILMALCVGGISLWTISHLTYDYEIQNMNHIVDTKATIINDELLRSENVVDYAANSVSREIKDPAKLRDPEFQHRMAEFVDNDFQNAKTDLNIICSYYLYYPSANVSALWKASDDRDEHFYDVLERQRTENSRVIPRHVLSFAYLMDEGQASWTQPYYSTYLKRYIISYLSPVYKDGVMVAIIGVDLDFQAFIDRLYANPPEGEHGMIILSDATGTVEYSPEKPLVDKDIHLKDTPSKVTEAGQTDRTMLTYTWAGEPSIAGIKTLRNGMNFIDLRQIPQIYDRTRKAFIQMGFGLIAVCILASLLPLYIISRLSERLQLVIEAAKEVGEGNYDVKLHDTQPDDIGELSRNFQAMAEKVAAAQGNLTYMSQHDVLTGILNRMGLDKEVADWLKAHPASHGALVSLDLDGFKFINDLHGHMAGDEALRTLAKDLIESFGHDQIIGRNGGDEFVVFMKDTEPEQAEKVIKAFSSKVKTFTYDGETHAFSVSIGYTLYKGDGTSLSRLFHQSDTALYAVKLRGRNHYRAYEPTMENLNRTSLGFNLETITKNLPIALLVSEAKPDGKILFVNKTMVEMLECRNIREFMEFTQEYAPNVVCTCDRERMTKMVWEQSAREPDRPHCMSYSIHTAKGLDKRVFAIWRMADNPNYGEVFYATLMEASFLRELTSDDGECKA